MTTHTNISAVPPLEMPVSQGESAASQPAFAVCITTMNRVERLEACLANLERCTLRPAMVFVSDDSPDPAVRAANQAAVAAHPGVVYLTGPRRGVCANRNNAVRHCLEQAPYCSHVSFVDDDILVDPDFFEQASAHLLDLPEARRATTILTGGASSGPYLHQCWPLRLSFACYFTRGDVPQCVNMHCSMFPLALFTRDLWDENIFFGTEDAELCLRALRHGYAIELEPRMRSLDTMPGGGVLNGTKMATGLTRYQVCCEAARLYIGVKRYGVIERAPLRFAAFLVVYFGHLTLYLAKRGALSQILPIIRTSKAWRACLPGAGTAAH
ncbi:glycosyltransferase family 2 protein [Paraburkholderia unamae]|uniref:GT2 family glycosyltransferase n=1 Tax=Paraburkholderia unamae TaxID=219649 RepID=A0ABX5KME6_9BURK|nr:glycosyltransferase family 2 protein [Paraburkholderia unamae]PVX82243.1 GT2 family glycosyltransferase [Paraburkholderia unamae]RAR60572.1 GT2 family glycosyltransferase [Paraburkholderia unamae]CAG9272241.1 Glycosyltransferase like family 2 [Paraburkholderia unamae]